jgi:hypothetical protein
MTIWTSFFLVLSAVILAYPFLAPGDGSRGGGTRPYKNSRDLPNSVINSPNINNPDIIGPWHEEEVQLDLAAGRLGPNDHETSGQETGEEPAGADPVETSVSSEEDNGSLPEGPTAQ